MTFLLKALMIPYLCNVVFELPTGGFIQCPLGKLIHHNMTFGSSKFLLQQVPALDNKDEPNKLFAMNYIFYRDLKDWNISKEIALDRSAWRLAIIVPEP